MVMLHVCYRCGEIQLKNAQFLLYPRPFAVLYVSIMGLTRCYKTTRFYIYICIFSTEF